jgi:hypothetical protein
MFCMLGAMAALVMVVAEWVVLGKPCVCYRPMGKPCVCYCAMLSIVSAFDSPGV